MLISAGLLLSEYFKSLFECVITTILTTCFGINRHTNIRRHSSAIERLPGLAQIQLIRQTEVPAIRQFASDHVRKNSLGVFPDSHYMGLSSHQSHRKRFTATDRSRAE